MNNKSKPQACSVFGIRGAKVMPFLEMTKQNVNYFFNCRCKANVNQGRFPTSQIVFNSAFLWHKKVLIRHNPQ